MIPTIKPYDRCKQAGLSDRDHLILKHLSMGRSNKEIADRMSITVNAVSNALSAILDKVGVRGRVSLAMWLHHGPELGGEV